MLDGLDALAERVDGVARADGNASGGDHRAGVDALVDVVDGRRRLVDPGGERVLDRCAPGNSGSGDGCEFTIRPL